MTKSATDDYTHTKSTDKRRSPSQSTAVPLHFSVHKPGCHFESCCGICNLFPGVLLIAFCQVLIGSILITIMLTHSKQYDEMHQTQASQGNCFSSCAVCDIGHLPRYYMRLNPVMSMATGAVLTGVIGAGVLLIIVALTESCRAMLIYLLVAVMVWLCILSLAVTKIGRACVRFKDAPKIKDEQHRLANLACVTGLFTFLGAGEQRTPELDVGYNSRMVIYLFSFIVVFSFYHFRYVRRAILLHEAECG